MNRLRQVTVCTTFCTAKTKATTTDKILLLNYMLTTLLHRLTRANPASNQAPHNNYRKNSATIALFLPCLGA